MLNLFLQRTDILFGYFAEFFYFLGIKLIIDILNLFENALFMVLIHIVPAVTVQVRRLHDIGKSGAWFLLSFVPLGSLVLLYWAFQPSDGQQDYAEHNAARPRQRTRSTIPAGVRMGNSGRLSNGGPDLNEGRFI